MGSDGKRSHLVFVVADATGRTRQRGARAALAQSSRCCPLLCVGFLLFAACGPAPTPIPVAALPTATPSVRAAATVALASPVAHSAPPTDARKPTDTPPPTPVPATQILLIGNSLTFFNDLPGMLAALAQSGGHEVVVGMAAQGGWTCSDHAASPTTLDKIKQHNWDFVVLQEQSTIPAIAEQRDEYMIPAIRLLDRSIGESGANTVLFMAWAHRDGLPAAGYEDFADMQTQIQSGYMGIADELDALIAPVGIAWQHGIARDAGLDLWQADGLHPTREGSYLSACVLYATIFQQSPAGLAHRAGLSAETAQFLQAIAAETVLKDPVRWNIR